MTQQDKKATDAMLPANVWHRICHPQTETKPASTEKSASSAPEPTSCNAWKQQTQAWRNTQKP